ncbi:MAG: protein kinase [Nitrospinota bacterium]|nr:protein kinase [Nitrospinota bacterium]
MEQPKTLGRYEIVSELGRGGMGIVLKARDPRIDRLVALKIIKFDDFVDPRKKKEMLERFLVEARAAGKLTHPNIVTVYDVGEEEEQNYIAMEFIEGVDLADIMHQEKKLGFDRATRLILQVAEGLELAHENHIVHRDIKPANILVMKGDKVKITDFGLARLQDTASLTQTGQAVGSPQYMSPEQVNGEEIDGRSDIFSLGVMYYELVTGSSPFASKTLTSILLKIIKDDPPPPSTIKSDLPPAVDMVISKMMAKNTGDRYRVISDLVEDLYALLEDPDNFQMVPDSDQDPVVAFDDEEDAVDVDSEATQTLDTLGGRSGGSTQAINVGDDMDGDTEGGSTRAIPRRTPSSGSNRRTPSSGRVRRPPSPGSVASGKNQQEEIQDEADELESFLEKKARMESQFAKKFTQVLTVVFTDLKGSTTIAETEGDMASRMLMKSHNDIVFPAIAENQGTLVKTIGDGTLSHFDNAQDAVRASIRIQKNIDLLNLSGKFKTPILIRIGMHTGSCIIEKNDIFGDTVNTASRFESSAGPAEIFLSEETYNAMSAKEEFYLRFEKEVTLKGKKEPFRAYKAYWKEDEIEADRKGLRARAEAASGGMSTLSKVAVFVLIPLALVAALVLAGKLVSGSGDSPEKRSVEHYTVQSPETPATEPKTK